MKAVLYSLFLVVILGCFRANQKKYDNDDFVKFQIWDKFDLPVKGIACVGLKDSAKKKLDAIFQKSTQLYLLNGRWGDVDSLKFTKRGYVPLTISTRKLGIPHPNQLYLAKKSDDILINRWIHIPFKKDPYRIGLVTKPNITYEEQLEYEALIQQLGLVRDVAYQEKAFQYLKTKSPFQRREDCRIKFLKKANHQAFPSRGVNELQILKASDLVQHAGTVIGFKLLENGWTFVQLKPRQGRAFHQWCADNGVATKRIGNNFYLTWPSHFGNGLVEELNKLWETGFCEIIQPDYYVCDPSSELRGEE